LLTRIRADSLLCAVEIVIEVQLLDLLALVNEGLPFRTLVKIGGEFRGGF
jgi:hypothetical protein